MGHADSKRQRMELVEQLLLHRAMTPTELADAIDCHKSTIHDYLNEMRADYPLEDDGNGRYWIDRERYVSNVKLNRDEALSIYLALRRFVRQTSHAPSFFVPAIKKIANVLRHPDLTESIVESSMVLENDRDDAKAYTDVWRTLIQGWLENTTLRITYQKPRTESPDVHEFDPYLFEPAVLSHGVYVIGWSHTRQSLRTFKIERIIKAVPTLRTFERPSEITPDELLQHAWGVWYGNDLQKVELLFAPNVVQRVQETIWHPAQYTELLEDGRLYWCVEIAGLQELVPWIRGWGHEVEVIAPLHLREEIADSLKKAAALYE